MIDDVGEDTVLTHAGLNPRAHQGIVNPPVYHASTILFPTLEALEASERPDHAGLRYGRVGTPTSRAFEEAVARLEDGHGAVAVSSGLNAIATALTAFLK